MQSPSQKDGMEVWVYNWVNQALHVVILFEAHLSAEIITNVFEKKVIERGKMVKPRFRWLTIKELKLKNIREDQSDDSFWNVSPGFKEFLNMLVFEACNGNYNISLKCWPYPLSQGRNVPANINSVDSAWIIKGRQMTVNKRN